MHKVAFEPTEVDSNLMRFAFSKGVYPYISMIYNEKTALFTETVSMKTLDFQIRRGA